MKKILLFLLLTIFCGCKTIEIPVSEPWEGRYSTVDEFNDATKNIILKEKQQIWVLSNGTMYRLLKKVEK